jgi:hypothetical protein
MGFLDSTKKAIVQDGKTRMPAVQEAAQKCARSGRYRIDIRRIERWLMEGIIHWLRRWIKLRGILPRWSTA